MNMKKIVAIIEKGEDSGYGIYAADDSVPVVGDGLTEQEARASFEVCLHEQAAYMKEQTGAWPAWYSKDMRVEYL